MKGIVDWIRRAGPRDWLRLLGRLIPHIAIVISGMLIVFFLIDRVNKPMAFMTNEFHKVITLILSLISIALAVRVMAVQRREAREAYRRQLKRAQQTEPKGAHAARRDRGAEPARRSAAAAPRKGDVRREGARARR